MGKNGENFGADNFETFSLLEIGLVIRKLRKTYKISRDELSECTGVYYDTIKRIEDGRTSNPGFYTVAKLFAYFGFQISISIPLKEDNDG